MSKKTKELLQEILRVQKQILLALESRSAKKTDPSIITSVASSAGARTKPKKKKKKSS